MQSSQTSQFLTCFWVSEPTTFELVGSDANPKNLTEVHLNGTGKAGKVFIPSDSLYSFPIFHSFVCPQGRRNIGRAGEAVKKLRAMETYKKFLPMCLFVFSNNINLKNCRNV